MATSLIKRDVKYGNFTAESGITISQAKIAQVGNVVSVSLVAYKSGNFAANTETPIGTISGVDMPNAVVRSAAIAGSQPYIAQGPAYVGMGTNGAVAVRTQTAYPYIDVNYTYSI